MRFRFCAALALPMLSACTPSNAPNEVPVARLRAPVLADARQPVELVGGDSTDADGTLSSYAFSFGDGSPEVRWNQPSVQHVFVGAGRFTVRLTVTDDDGATDSVEQDVTLVDRFTPPYCGADAGCDTGEFCDTDAGICFQQSQ